MLAVLPDLHAVIKVTNLNVILQPYSNYIGRCMIPHIHSLNARMLNVLKPVLITHNHTHLQLMRKKKV